MKLLDIFKRKPKPARHCQECKWFRGSNKLDGLCDNSGVIYSTVEYARGGYGSKCGAKGKLWEAK